MSQRDFATSGRPVCKNSLFLKNRPLRHSEKQQLNQISVTFRYWHRAEIRRSDIFYESVSAINLQQLISTCCNELVN